MKRPRRRTTIGAIIASGIIIAGGITGGIVGTSGNGGGTSSGGGVLYMDPDGGSCVRYAPATPDHGYVDSEACQSMDAAYQAATPGDTVYVACKGGSGSCSYPDQTMPFAHRKTVSGHHCHLAAQFYEGSNTFSTQTQDVASCIKFLPKPGSVPLMDGGAVIQVPYVWMYGLTFSTADGKGQLAIQNYSGTSGCAVNPNPFTDIIIQNNIMTHFFVNSVQYLSMDGNTFDGANYIATTTSNAVQPGCGSQGTGADGGTMYKFLFSHNTVEHVFYTSTGQHVEGVHWWSSDHVDIDGNRFLDVCQLGISMQGDSDVEKNVLIQNNVFGKACVSSNNLPNGSNHVLATSGQQTFAADDHFMVRFNSCPWDDYCPTLYGSDQWPDYKIIGNIMGNMQGGCTGDTNRGGVFDYTYSFSSTQTCGSHAQGLSCNGIGCVYTNAPADVYTIQAGLSPTPIDMVPTSVAGGCPATDIVGTARGSGGLCTAGAYES